MNTEMAPYRHAEVVRIEECRSCIYRSKRNAKIARISRAVGKGFVYWAPWATFSWIETARFYPSNWGGFFAIAGLLTSVGLIIHATFAGMDAEID